MTTPDPFRDVTAALTRFLVAKATVGETLQWAAGLAVTAVSSAEGAGLTLLEGRERPVTVFTSNADLSSEVDQVQYRDDVGPCLEAYRNRTVVRVGDSVKAADRWPGYARAAAAAGVGSSLSLPLMAGEEVYGALNLYARTVAAFDDVDVSRARVFATHASVVLANANAYWDTRDLAADLQEAMDSRAVIDMAKGKLMASGHYSAAQAFQVLVTASQQSKVRLRDIAFRIVHDEEPSALTALDQGTARVPTVMPGDR